MLPTIFREIHGKYINNTRTPLKNKRTLIDIRVNKNPRLALTQTATSPIPREIRIKEKTGLLSGPLCRNEVVLLVVCCFSITVYVKIQYDKIHAYISSEKQSFYKLHKPMGKRAHLGYCLGPCTGKSCCHLYFY